MHQEHTNNSKNPSNGAAGHNTYPEKQTPYQPGPPNNTRLAPIPFRKSHTFSKIFWPIFIIILLAAGFLFTKIYSLGSRIFVSHNSFFSNVKELVFGKPAPLVGEAQGKVNILLLGYGGVGHDGPYLTDTIMLATLDLDNKKVLLSSIPRDYYAPNPLGNKINDFFAEGFTQGQNNYDLGGQRAREEVAQLTGIDVPYFASLDFQGFIDAINRIGGVDINVPRTFTDDQYPAGETTGYLPPVTFTQGMQHMDGSKALIFARSRHGNNGEGSDFARSRRQQLVLAAFKDKVLKLNLFNDTATINDLLNILADHFHTNIDPAQLVRIAQTMRTSQTTITSQSLDLASNLICNKTLPDTGEYVLAPCPGVTISQIQNFFQNGLQYAGVHQENASVILENASGNTGQYQTIKQELLNAGITVFETRYRGALPLNTSLLYEVHAQPATEQYISGLLGITPQPKPKAMLANSDLVLIIGGGTQ